MTAPHTLVLLRHGERELERQVRVHRLGRRLAAVEGHRASAGSSRRYALITLPSAHSDRFKLNQPRH